MRHERQLFFERGDGVLEHRAVRRRSGGGEIGARARQRQLDGAAAGAHLAFFGRQTAAGRRCAFFLGLLILDVLALEPSGHVVNQAPVSGGPKADVN